MILVRVTEQLAVGILSLALIAQKPGQRDVEAGLPVAAMRLRGVEEQALSTETPQIRLTGAHAGIVEGQGCDLCRVSKALRLQQVQHPQLLAAEHHDQHLSLGRGPPA